jgi:hypothetical protein
MVAVAYFVSPHGFGHAARACAVIQALFEHRSDLSFEVFTTVPEWFFSESLTAPFTYHEMVTDVGLVQRDALTEDAQATADRLDELLSQADFRLDQIAARLHQLACRIVICDIAPLGLAAADLAGLPSVLIESFTWDWIYQAYLDECPELARHIPQLEKTFDLATLHIQAQPACRPHPDAEAVAPISRRPRRPRDQVRAQLGVAETTPLVVVTMGGVPWRFSSLEALQNQSRTCFLVLGDSEEISRRDNLIILPHHSGLYHPDLTACSDAVIGKLGYSTMAEAFQSAVRLGFIPRSRFPESPTLARFAESEMNGVAISQDDFVRGRWLDQVEVLLSGSAPARLDQDGAGQAARLIVKRFDHALQGGEA